MYPELQKNMQELSLAIISFVKDIRQHVGQPTWTQVFETNLLAVIPKLRTISSSLQVTN